MELLLIVVIAGFAVVGLVKGARSRQAARARGHHYRGRPQDAGTDPTYYADSGGSHHHHGHSHGSSGHHSGHHSGDSYSDGGGGDSGGGDGGGGGD